MRTYGYIDAHVCCKSYLLSEYAMAGSSNLERKKWYIDSGASTHIISDRSLFTTIREVDEPINGVGGGTTIRGRGDVQIILGNGSNNFHIKLRNAAWIPESSNLISVPRIDDGDGRVEFSQGEARWYSKTGDLLCVGKRHRQEKGALYEIYPKLSNKGNPDQAYSAKKPKARSWQEWHSALGHISFQALKTLQKSNQHWMAISDWDTKELKPCDACQDRKSVV